MKTRFDQTGHHAALVILGSVLVGSMLVAGPITAQQIAPRRGADTTDSMSAMSRSGMMGMMSMMHDCPMMTAMAQSPAAALDRRKALGLTADQVRQLEEVRAREAAVAQLAMDSMRVLHDRLASLADAPQFDEGGVRAVFERMGALHTDVGVAMLRARHEARAVLTPQQRQKLAAESAGMKGMPMNGISGAMGGMMGSGSGGTQCPMMRGTRRGRTREAAPAGTRDSAAAKMPRHVPPVR